MSLAIPVNQRAFFTRQFTRVTGAEERKSCSLQGVGSYSVERLPTDSIGTFALTLNNVVAGSRVHVEVLTTGATVHDALATTSTVLISLPAYVAGSANNDLIIKVRKASESPFYRPYSTQAVASVGSAAIYIEQQLDE
jgi:hypothetical protein